MTKSHNSCKTCNIAKSDLYNHLNVQLVTVCEYEQTPSRGVGGVAHTRCFPYMLYSKKRTKSHNSCKTCDIAKSNLNGYLHVKLVYSHERTRTSTHARSLNFGYVTMHSAHFSEFIDSSERKLKTLTVTSGNNKVRI